MVILSHLSTRWDEVGLVKEGWGVTGGDAVVPASLSFAASFPSMSVLASAK